jgi:hypothetical protein
MRLNIAKEKLQKLADEYVQKDAEGKLMKIEEEGVFKSWVFITEEHEKHTKKLTLHLLVQHLKSIANCPLNDKAKFHRTGKRGCRLNGTNEPLHRSKK